MFRHWEPDYKIENIYILAAKVKLILLDLTRKTVYF